MTHYLIDYENVKDLSGIEELSNKDNVIIFYSNNANTITIQTHRKISASNARISYKEANVGGKNALDFQLSTYIGYLISSYPNDKFYILSKDKGFEHVADFWKKEKGVKIELIVNFTGQTQKKLIEDNTNQIKELLKKSQLQLQDKDINIIVDTVKRFKTKTAINNNLSKEFKDTEKAGKILKVIKSCIKDKK